MDLVSLICTFLFLPSTGPFGCSLASGSIGTPKIGDPLGSSRVSSQKQNREGVVGAQNGQYYATVESSPGCGGGPGQDVTYMERESSRGRDRVRVR
ncbi:hypothetical protein DVH24_031396 [Malus domestica]|uniref:Secreted protein n=1 Tax=Malus domestica TaxID=3750 RepID=A0A498HJD0_MALDO|nr:hypothetical protein DVH24_031396 [Malus domestica]